MKSSLVVIVLAILPSLSHAIPNEVNKLTCPSLLMGSRDLKVPAVVDEIANAYLQLKDMPKYLNTEGSLLKINPQAKVQLENLRRAFRGTPATLDRVTAEFRARLSTDSLERRWRATDGWEIRDLTNLNNELLLFGRVVGEKDGVLLVALPPTEILSDKADEVPIQFHYLAPVQYKSDEPQDAFQAVNKYAPLIEEKIKTLNEQAHAAIAVTGKPYRNPTFHLNFNDEKGFFFVERSFTLYRADIFRNPGLSKLLSVFN